MRPEIRYARSGDVSIAYTLTGEGEREVVVVPGYVSNLDVTWDVFAATGERLSAFARLVMFDKRGTGLSDPVDVVPTLEVRMDDVRAVMDDAGFEKAALVGVSEGGAMSILFAATYPDRVTALVLLGAMARTTQAPDYPFGTPAEALAEADAEIAPYWGSGITAELFVPSIADFPGVRDIAARIERTGASPAMRKKYYDMFVDVDVRGALSSVRVPTLVLHHTGDRVVNVRAGRWLAEQIPGARFVELPGIDHSMIGDPAILDEIEAFLTGVRPVAVPDRILATVMFTDIVGSTAKAAELGDAEWRGVLESQQRVVRAELDRFRGHEVKSTGDGFLATFDGPARAVQCGQAIVGAVRALGIEVRVGLHSGEVEIMGSDVGGIAVHIASRVGSLAGTGEVLVSETVKGLVAGSGITFDERGEHELKGIPDTWRLFAARIV